MVVGQLANEKLEAEDVQHHLVEFDIDLTGSEMGLIHFLAATRDVGMDIIQPNKEQGSVLTGVTGRSAVDAAQFATQISAWVIEHPGARPAPGPRLRSLLSRS